MLPLKLRNWIDKEKLNWVYLSRNSNAVQMLEKDLSHNGISWGNLSTNKSPRAIRLFEQNLDKVVWSYLSFNPEAVDILERHPDKIDWNELSGNPNPRAIQLLENYVKYHPDKPEYSREVWDILSGNPAAIHLLEANPHKIDWDWFSENPKAIHVIEKNLDKVDWFGLSYNPNAIHILENNLHKVRWQSACCNPNPEIIHLLERHLDKLSLEHWSDLNFHPHAIPLLEKYPDKIDFSSLSENPNAIHILEKTRDKINWDNFSLNPSIFVYDYDQMREDKQQLHSELLEIVLHPDNFHKFEDWGIFTLTPDLPCVIGPSSPILSSL